MSTFKGHTALAAYHNTPSKANGHGYVDSSGAFLLCCYPCSGAFWWRMWGGHASEMHRRVIGRAVFRLHKG